jgi:hypothetical protein
VAALNGGVEVSGGLLGGHAQLVVQHYDTLLELAQGGGALAGPGIEAHELAVGSFVQGVEGQLVAGKGQGGFEFAPGAVPQYQPVQGTPQFAAQIFGLQELPFVKVKTVLEAKAA